MSDDLTKERDDWHRVADDRSAENTRLRALLAEATGAFDRLASAAYVVPEQPSMAVARRFAADVRARIAAYLATTTPACDALDSRKGK